MFKKVFYQVLKRFGLHEIARKIRVNKIPRLSNMCIAEIGDKTDLDFISRTNN